MKQIICTKCNKPFDKYPIIDGKRQRLHHRKYCLDCVPFKSKFFRKENKEFVCKECQKKFTRMATENQDFDFCSTSCSTTFHNKAEHKISRTKKCKCCQSLILSEWTYCKKCIKEGKHLNGESYIANRTLKECIGENSKPANKYRRVRLHACRITKQFVQKCKKCGYDKHVEVCHIKPIGSFDLDTKIFIINDQKNIVLLCRNCHWELDHGMLDPNKLVGDSGLEPPTLDL